MSVEWPNQHEGKVWLATKGIAKRVERKHDRQACRKCTTGRYLWRWYDCRVGGTLHHHVGHKPVNGWKALRLQAQEVFS